MSNVNTREIITGEEADRRSLTGVKAVYEVARAAYGPRSGNVGIEAPYGDPIFSHDGVFNVDKLHLEDSVANMAARAIVQASKMTNQHAGDGTTAAVILAYWLYVEARKKIDNKMENRMTVARLLHTSATEVIKYIESIKKSVDSDLLKHVATTSASDKGIGTMIATAIEEVGQHGGIVAENFAGSGIYADLVEGFYFRKGFSQAMLLTDPSNLESRFDNVAILITEKPLQTTSDVAVILEKVLEANIRELVIIGTVSDEGLSTLIKNRLDGNITATVVDAPVFGSLRTLFFDDLAMYTGGKVLLSGANASDFELQMLGEGKILINEWSTTILNGDGSNSKALKGRISELEAEAKVAPSSITQEALRERLGRLNGKVALIRVGGSTPAEQQEVKLRVEDAIAATHAALKEGIVPGGGVTLARLDPKIPFYEAYQKPFKTLMNNAGLNSEVCLWNVLKAKEWHGYDLREDHNPNEPHLTDLLKAGVIDPTMVVKEVVSNATSIAAELIKTEIWMPLSDRENKRG